MTSNCSICGEPTQLHVMGRPICVKCEGREGEQRRRGPERASAVSRIEQIMGGGSVEFKSASANQFRGGRAPVVSHGTRSMSEETASAMLFSTALTP